MYHLLLLYFIKKLNKYKICHVIKERHKVFDRITYLNYSFFNLINKKTINV